MPSVTPNKPEFIKKRQGILALKQKILWTI